MDSAKAQDFPGSRRKAAPARRAALWPLVRDHARAVLTLTSAVLILTGWLLDRSGAPAAAVAAYLAGFGAGGYFSARQGLHTLFYERDLDVDLLMVVAASGAASIGYWADGAILILIFALSGTLEHYALVRTRRDISALMSLRPETATRLREGREERVAVEDLRPGDRILVKAGERIPADGRVLEGWSAVDEAAITGESVPVDKEPGAGVYAGTINGPGVLTIEMTVAAGETLLARLIRLVEEARSEKPATQLFIEKFGRRYSRAVVVTALLVGILPPFLLGWTWTDTVYRAMIFLVVASPCALMAAMMPAVLSAISNAARNGVLFKGGMHLETLGEVRAVCLDKTGTVTTGRPRVTDVIPLERDLLGDRALALAAALESRSDHPLARAVVEAAHQQGLALAEPQEVEEVAGFGLRGKLAGAGYRIGRPEFLAQEGAALPGPVREAVAALQGEGKTVAILAREGSPLALIALRDTTRREAALAIQRLRRLGVEKVVLLTGDNRRAGEALGREVACDEVRTELLPEDKVRLIKELAGRHGKVAMVGDGVNDAPALASAAVGVAMGAHGTDVALETADVVLVSDDLSRLPYAIELGRRVRRVVRQNIAFALGVIAVLIASNFLQVINLPLAVVGHEGSTVLVILNGLRLLAGRPREGAAAAPAA